MSDDYMSDDYISDDYMSDDYMSDDHMTIWVMTIWVMTMSHSYSDDYVREPGQASSSSSANPSFTCLQFVTQTTRSSVLVIQFSHH
jgi:hypothetical protein